MKLAAFGAVMAMLLVWGSNGAGGQSGGGTGPIAADAGGNQEFVVHPDISSIWPSPNLTYGFMNHTGDLSNTAQENAIAKAFASWASVTPLTFTQVADCGLAMNDPGCTTPDIRIGFFGRDHGPDDWDPLFDGVGHSLAHAFYGLPSTGTLAGDIHFDDAENWTTSLRSGRDVQSVALHEIGHVLGIKHSDNALCATSNRNLLRPTMCETLVLDRGLAPDDVAAVRSLYGSAGTTCAGFPVTVRLSAGQHPTAGDDVIQGTTAGTTINSAGGRDVVCGGAGPDNINSGKAGDRIYGGQGNDTCNGGGGADFATQCEHTVSIP